MPTINTSTRRSSTAGGKARTAIGAGIAIRDSMFQVNPIEMRFGSNSVYEQRSTKLFARYAESAQPMLQWLTNPLRADARRKSSSPLFWLLPSQRGTASAVAHSARARTVGAFPGTVLNLWGAGPVP